MVILRLWNSISRH